MDDIIVSDLTKKFVKKGKRKLLRREKEDILAVDHISVKVKKGELFGLLGPNGAGKTTLVKCLATLLIPDEGTATIDGHDIITDPISVRKILGITTGGERTLYWKLSARDNLKYFASLYGLSSKDAEERIDYLLGIMDLKKKQHQRLEKYSTGMRQKVSIARAILHDPKILLLDEPTLGLDPSFSMFLRSFIKNELNKKEGKTILLTTHYMDEADQLCDRIAFVDKGKLIVVDTSKNLKKNVSKNEALEIKCIGNIEKLENFNAHIKNKKNYTKIRILHENTEDIMDDVLKDVKEKAKILSVNVTRPTLEDVFVHLTGSKLEDEYE
ncbi:MAG: ABC transporter ATP-binding protein [Methanomicrobia archaeon]|nr:ABC transporter ATP-binding protein [Methanomicrobia archaeon]HDN81978.1 ABC transporter ATP-binding protein [Methanomicrobia archaeon]